MLPKIILPFILLFEIFYLKHIKIFYSLSFLFLLPLLYRFIYYNLYRYYLQQLEEISEVLNVVVGSLENEKEPLELLDNTGYHFFLQDITMDRLYVRKLTYSFHFSFKASFVQSNYHMHYLKNFQQFVIIFAGIFIARCINSMKYYLPMKRTKKRRTFYRYICINYLFLLLVLYIINSAFGNIL